MRCLHCGTCCTRTEMLLSARDIKRLEKKGYLGDSFCSFDEEGYVRLKNAKRSCVFYDVEKQRCKVYSFRPSGCRLYPVIFDEQKGIILDHICRAASSLSDKQIAQKGWIVLKLLDEIDAEARKRRGHNQF